MSVEPELRLPERVTATGAALGTLGGMPERVDAWAKRWLTTMAIAQGYTRWQADEMAVHAQLVAHEVDAHDRWLTVWVPPDGRELRVLVLVP